MIKNVKNKYIPAWLKILGRLSRSIPNFYWIKCKLMWFLMPRIRGKNYKTIINHDIGQKIFLDLNDWIPIQMFWMGIYFVERRQAEHFKKLVKLGDVVIDVGANIGYYTLMAAPRVGKKGHVYSFEPAFSAFRILQKNVEINNFTNVSLYNLALLDKKTTVDLYLLDSTNTGSATITRPESFSGKTEKVKCTTLDDFVRESNIKKVDIVKIDVEGAEPRVLNGMEKTLSEQSPKILIEINEERLKSFGYSKDYIYEFLFDKGYNAHSISGNKTEPLSRYIEDNLILFSKVRNL